MTREEKRTIERIFQGAADELWQGLPDRLDVRLVNSEIRCSYIGWSSGLFRHRIERKATLAAARRWGGQTRKGARWRDMAVPVMHAILDDTITWQHELHIMAHGLGLVVNGKCHDLPLDQWVIDTSLLQLLDASDYDIRQAAAAIVAAPSDYLAYGADKSIWMHWMEKLVIVAHGENGLPIISTMMTIGGGLYEDRILEVPQILPNVIMDAAAGRLLGTIVETGVGHLDARVIEKIIPYTPPNGGWHNDSKTAIHLQPDYVELGAIHHSDADARAARED